MSFNHGLRVHLPADALAVIDAAWFAYPGRFDLWTDGVRTVLQAWVPWDSPEGRRLKELGAVETAHDECAAMVDDRQQSVSLTLRPKPKQFRLVRESDESGVSGEGHVVDGIVWADGTVSLRWRTHHRSTSSYDSIDAVKAIHGHGGKTRVEWVETPDGSSHAGDQAEPTGLVLACARAAHEANRAYCIAIGDLSQKPWDEAEPWQRESAIRGVEVALGGATPEQQHEAWCADKYRDGWTYGSVKDPVALTHPCLVAYEDLPEAQRRKDALYIAVVNGMAAALAKQAEVVVPDDPAHPRLTPGPAGEFALAVAEEPAIVSLAERRLEPVARVVEVLEDMLARAKAGEVRGVAIGTACDAKCDGSVYAIGDQTIATLVLAVERVKLRLLEHCE
jgi:hypothetical protein